MPGPSFTDQEFLDAWAATPSPVAVANALGVTTRAVYSRRRRIEDKIGRTLVAWQNEKRTAGKFGRGATESPYHAQLHAAPTRLHDTVKDGSVVIFSDAHYWPGIVSTAHRALVHLIGEIKPKIVIANGDIFDMVGPSHWGRRDWSPQPNVRQELEAVQERLAEVEDAAGKRCRLVRTIGNHCVRFTRKLVNSVPEFDGVRGFALKDHLPRWQECWSIHLNERTDGWTEIKHRWKGGVHSSFNNAKEASVHYATGHDHALRVQEFTNRRGTWYGINSGTLADPEGPQFSYAEDSPLNHRSGFVVLTYHEGHLLRPAVCKVLTPDTVDFERKVIKV